MNSITFNIDQFEQLFPFYLLVNSNMEIASAGPSMRKLIAEIPHCSFNDCFHVLRPENAAKDFHSLRSHQQELIVLQTKRGQPLMLRGQLEALDNDRLLFIGSPWFGSMDEVKARGLVMNDFAYHDPMIDLLHVIKTQEIATSESKALLQKVNEQKTELKKAHQEAQELALLPTQNPDPILRLDMEGKILLQNPAAENLPVKMTYNGVVYTQADFWKKMVPAIKAQGERYMLEASAGERFFSFACIVQQEGYINVYGRDITAETTAKQAMEEQRAFYEQILNKIPADIAVFDKEHRYLFVNPLAIKDEEMRRWIIGKKDEDYLRHRNKPLEQMHERNEIFKRVIQSGKLESFEESFQQPDGSVMHHLRNFFPVVNDKGEVELMIGYGLNITERKKMEQALEAARLKAEQETELKNRFFATMSHEIRTPLNGILGITELLSETQLNMQQQEYVHMMKASGNHLLRVVNDVLDFERITNNKIQLEQTEFDLVQTIEDICRIFRVNAEEKGLGFDLRTQEQQLWVKADAYRLSQVLHNLCGNAVKFTQQGGVEVIVSSTVYESSTAQISITVKDTGMGIEPELQQTIFEPYAQGKTFIARQYGGTGLGLAICKKLVDLLGGSINVKSQPGIGSAFTVQFHWPLASTTESSSEKRIHHSIVPATPLHVLVAEDAPINQYLIRHMLEKWGCSYFLAENGVAAVEALKQQHFDLVLMDIEMPQMDGIEATQQIRKMEDKTKASLPIIALTANAMKGNREEYLTAGMNDYITKPFQEQQLLEAIGRFAQHVPIRETRKEKAASTKKKLYDLTYLQSLSADEQFLQEMITLYINTTPELIQKLTKAVTQRNADKLASALHKLKPAASTIGMADLKESIEQLEALIKTGKTSKSVYEKAEAIVCVFQECIEQLKNDKYK